MWRLLFLRWYGVVSPLLYFVFDCSGRKTALMLELCKALRDKLSIGAVSALVFETFLGRAKLGHDTVLSLAHVDDRLPSELLLLTFRRTTVFLRRRFPKMVDARKFSHTPVELPAL